MAERPRIDGGEAVTVPFTQREIDSIPDVAHPFMRQRWLTAGEAYRLRRCARPGCANVFIRHKDGEYCNDSAANGRSRCSQMVRSRRFYDKKIQGYLLIQASALAKI